MATSPAVPVSSASIASTSATSESPDYLAGALLQSLMRPLDGPFSFSLIGTFFLSLISLGVFPMALLPARLRDFTRRERDQLYHLAQWLRLQFGTNADAIWDPTPGMNRFIMISRLIVYASTTAILIGFVQYLVDGHALNELFAVTLGVVVDPRDHRMLPGIYQWWLTWTCIGYVACWMMNIGHQTRVHEFVGRFNKLAVARGLAPAELPTIAVGLNLFWLAAGIIFAFNGMLWALPAALAGGVQRRYTRRESRSIRGALAQRVRDLLARTRPELHFAIPTALRRKCSTERCWARLPVQAVFCPRCGKRVPS